MPPTSAILYKNATNTVFLIDIPTSIALAQKLSPAQAQTTNTGSEQEDTPHHASTRRSRSESKVQIYSSAPLNEPYVLSAEPKSDAARARVLDRIPVAERVFYTEVVGPLVQWGLSDIRENFSDSAVEWCFPRRVFGDDGFGESSGCGPETEASTPHLSSSTAIEAGDGDEEDAPLILAPGVNLFSSLTDLRNLSVRNTSAETATIRVANYHASFHVPPLSSFALCKIPLSQSQYHTSTATSQSGCSNIPGLPSDQKFNLVLLDPPWHNKSVRRSRQYRTQSYREDDGLTQGIAAVLSGHLYSHRHPRSYSATIRGEGKEGVKSLAAIWITNSSKTRAIAEEAMRAAGRRICEEWIWIKTTTGGEPISAVDGLWRKPYEILLIGMEDDGRDLSPQSVTRRVIAAVPDVHSRKPNLREVFERVFFSCPEKKEEDDREVMGSSPYAAMEVFARNLTAGWWAIGDEVLKFNEDLWWYQG